MSLRLKLGLLTAAVTLGSVLAVGGYFAKLAYGLAEERIREKAEALALNVAANSAVGVYSENLFRQLNPLMASIRLDPDVESASIHDRGGRTLAHTDAPRVGEVVAGEAAWCRRQRAGGGVSVAGPHGDLVEVRAPVRMPVEGLEGARGRGGVIGVVRLQLSFARLRRQLWRLLATSGLATLGLVAVGLSLGAVLSRRATRPLHRIVEADEAAVRGSRERAHIPEAEMPPDEVGQIMRSRERMLLALRRSEDEHRALAVAERAKATQLEVAYRELKNLQERLTQAEKLSVMGQVVAGVAHELNNPLTGIMGYAQLLLQHGEIRREARLREGLERILHQSRRCQKIVKNLSEFGRQHKPEKMWLDINRLVGDTLALEAHQFETRNIHVREELDAEPMWTMADYFQLQQVLLNLFVNAQQALVRRGGTGTLTLRTRRSGGRVRIEIEDDGPGIPAEMLPRIFEPFFTTKGPGEGTGLGLSLSYGIVNQHGGDIWAESGSRQGALFVVELPMLAEPGWTASAQTSIRVALPAGRTVLVVEDEEVVAELLCEVLRELGDHPEVARDGASAVEKLLGRDYDAVLCDVHFPGGDGFTLYRWMKESKPHLERCWAFMTGSVGPETMTCLQETGRPILAKPFDLMLVQETLAPMLQDGPREGEGDAGAARAA